MEGTLESCKMCKGKMNIAAQRLGISIEYKYPDENGKIVSWVAKSPATRSVLLRAAGRGAMSNPGTKALLKAIFKVIIDDTFGKALGVWDLIPGQLYDGSIQRQMYWKQKHPGQKYYKGIDGC